MKSSKAGASGFALGKEESLFEPGDGVLKSAILLITDVDCHWISNLQGPAQIEDTHFDVAPSTKTAFAIGLGHSSEERTS
jgi:hypothetical protein